MRIPRFLVSAVILPSLFCSGCGGLDLSARGEGTGIQIVGAIVVLAKYKASGRQKAIAEEKARRAYVDLAMKPAYEAKAKKLRRVAGKPTVRPSSGASSTASQTAKNLKSARARGELAALAGSWRKTAASITNGKYAGDFATDGGSSSMPSESALAAFTPMSESQVMADSAAYLPKYLAVPVPADQSVAGSKSSVMLWDPRANRLASDTVYVLDRVPTGDKPTEIDNQKVLFAGR